LFKLPIDPLDNGLIINETAFYLSTSYSSNFRANMDLEEFKQEINSSNKNSDTPNQPQQPNESKNA
jgi:hypothetical protein